MSIPMQLLLVVAAFCVCLSEGAPDGRIARAKQQRPTRGFKNLEMMTARGFGKRGRPSPRTERDVHDQMPSERTYRAAPTFKSPSVNFGGGYGKRMPEIEPEGDVEEQAPPERTSRGSSFKKSSLRSRAGYGKITPEMELEGNLEDQSLLERINRAPPTFKPPSVIFARGVGKRRQDMEPEGNVEDQSRLERINRALPTFQTPTVIFGRDVGKRTQEMETEDFRRFNPKGSMMVATDFGKRSNDENTEEVYGLDNFWEMLPGSPEREGQEADDDKLESIPMDWFVNEIVNNPDFARSVVRKFIDINQDGMLSSDELLRNV